MGAGASTLPESLSEDDVKQFVGEKKYSATTFELHADDDGRIPREVLLKLMADAAGGPKLNHAQSMPPSKHATLPGSSEKSLVRPGSVINTMAGKSFALKSPASVKDLAMGYLLTRKQAWEAPRTPQRKPRLAGAFDAALVDLDAASEQAQGQQRPTQATAAAAAAAARCAAGPHGARPFARQALRPDRRCHGGC